MTAVVLAVVIYALHMHQLELNARQPRITDLEGFREAVESRMHDRWTETEYWEDKAKTLDRLARDNPELVIDEELKYPPAKKVESDGDSSR